jgi:hypothetical protein
MIHFSVGIACQSLVSVPHCGDVPLTCDQHDKVRRRELCMNPFEGLVSAFNQTPALALQDSCPSLRMQSAK